jgi:hypothetical protein
MSVLWRDSVTYEANRTYELTLMAVGSSLRAFIDAVPLFAVTDSEIASGRIALYSSNNSNAWFSEVRVWPAQQGFGRWLRRSSEPTRRRGSAAAGMVERAR